MKPHIQYLWYVLRHKWFVLVAGLKTDAPLWRLLIHDYSKFSRAEWSAYVHQFYAKDRKRVGAFERAWLHHQNKNPHHWQYWVNLRYDGKHKPVVMPTKFAREMVADWMGAGRAITGHWDIDEWYAKNKGQMIIHPVTVVFIEAIMRDIAKQGE